MSAGAAAASLGGDRTRAPLGRRRAEVTDNAVSGGYRIVTAADGRGPVPQPGQFYMLAAERYWGEGAGRPFLPRAFSVAEVERDPDAVRLRFLLEDVGPGTRRLAALEPGEGMLLTGPLGRPFSAPRELEPDAAGAILVGGGIGLAPLAILRRRLAEGGVPVRTLLGFRDERHAGGLELFRCCEVGLASEDGHVGHRGYVTDLLARVLEGDVSASAVVYACGPPAMLEAVRLLCADRDLRCELALEAPMACGYGACYGCAVPLAGGGYMRLCVDGPVVPAERIETALVPGAGHGAGARIAPASRPGVRGNDPGAGAAGTTAPPRAAPSGETWRTSSASRPGMRGNDPGAEGSGPVGTAAPVEGAGGPVEFCGLVLEHPIVNGSGTFDAIAARRAFGGELLERFPFSAFVTKTVTPAPRAGNPPPRLWEEGAGMINSIGLPNRGLAGFLDHDLPALSELGVPLIVSVMGTSAEEFVTLVEAVAARDEVAALELNVSCPNVHSGLIVGEQPSETSALVRRLRPLTEKPLVVKLTPNVADPSSVAIAAEEGGADAVSLINTIKATALDPAGEGPWLGAGSGGFSGPAIRVVALKQVADVASAVSIPLVGMGGVETGADAADLLRAGATLVAVGTASFRDPLAARRIRDELATAS